MRKLFLATTLLTLSLFTVACAKPSTEPEGGKPSQSTESDSGSDDKKNTDEEALSDNKEQSEVKNMEFVIKQNAEMLDNGAYKLYMYSGKDVEKIIEGEFEETCVQDASALYEKVILDQDGVKLTISGSYDDNLYLQVENNTDSIIELFENDLFINGVTGYKYLVNEHSYLNGVQPGQTAKYIFKELFTYLDEIKMDKIINFTGKIHVSDNEYNRLIEDTDFFVGEPATFSFRGDKDAVVSAGNVDIYLLGNYAYDVEAINNQINPVMWLEFFVVNNEEDDADIRLKRIKVNDVEYTEEADLKGFWSGLWVPSGKASYKALGVLNIPDINSVYDIKNIELEFEVEAYVPDFENETSTTTTVTKTIKFAQ